MMTRGKYTSRGYPVCEGDGAGKGDAVGSKFTGVVFCRGAGSVSEHRTSAGSASE